MKEFLEQQLKDYWQYKKEILFIVCCYLIAWILDSSFAPWRR